MEPSIRSLEPVNRSPLCGRGESNFKADPKRKKEKENLSSDTFTKSDRNLNVQIHYTFNNSKLLPVQQILGVSHQRVASRQTCLDTV